jgi:hypothetical protein
VLQRVPYRRMAPYRDICCPNRDHALPVERQRRNCRPANRRYAQEWEAIGRPDEVVTPHMLPGVEQRDNCTSLGVSGCCLDCFSAIAVKAGQSQILWHRGATLSEWHDMINGEGHVLPLLYGMAVLAERPSTLAYLLLHGTRQRATARHLRGILRLGALESVADYSVQEAQIVIEVFILIKLHQFIWGEGHVSLLA